MLRTRTERALVVWAAVSLAAGFALVYGLGDSPRHPRDMFYYMYFGNPIGILRPPMNDNPGAAQRFERLCERGDPHMLDHRQVIMCVEDRSSPELRTKVKDFVAQVDADYRRYYLEVAVRVLWSLLAAAALWLTLVVAVIVGRWVALGESRRAAAHLED